MSDVDPTRANESIVKPESLHEPPKFRRGSASPLAERRDLDKSSYNTREQGDSEAQAFDITVILNVHREVLFLRRTLLSLAEAVAFARYRDGLRLEVVVVLDNSDERTRSFATADRFAFFDACQIIEVSNGSLALSRNSGIACANGKYVTTCDADDLLSYNMLAESFQGVEAAKNNKVAIFPEYVLAFGDTSHLCRYYDSGFIPKQAFLDYHPFNSRILISTAYVKDHPYTHADHRSGFAYEDWHYNCNLIADDFELLVAPSTTLYYRKRSGSLLREANATSLRTIHLPKLFQPQTFLARCKEGMDRCPEGDWMPPSADEVAESFFTNPLLIATAAAANRIDPAVMAESRGMTEIFSNLQGRAKQGSAYFKACQALSRKAYTDIVLVPYVIAGGAEKYILGVLSGLALLGRTNGILFLAGQHIQEHRWLDRLPPMSDFIDLYELANGDMETVEVITLRLIQSVGDNCRVHLKSCEYAEKFILKYAKVLSAQQLIYYRFCDDVFDSHGETWTYGGGFNFLSEVNDQISLLISDHNTLIARDRDMLHVNAEKWVNVPIRCELPKQTWQSPVSTMSRRLLWASRIGRQKRPKLIWELARRLYQGGLTFEIDMYGYPDPGVSVADFENCPGLTYRGGFDGLHSLELDRYSAFVYTSRFDGLPNIVLEAMAAGMPVIAPKLGGIPEVIEHGESGWLVDTVGDDTLDAQAYVEQLKTIEWHPEVLSRIGSAAREVVRERHSENAMLQRLSEVFVRPEDCRVAR